MSDIQIKDELQRIDQQIKDELHRIELPAVWCVVEILESNCRNPRIPKVDLLLVKIIKIILFQKKETSCKITFNNKIVNETK